MKTAIKKIKILGQLLLLLLLTSTAFIVITSRTDKLAGIRSMVVLTGSMEPTLPVGSVILTRPNKGFYNLGDVVSFTNKDGLIVTHRIVQGYKDLDGSVVYQLKGDANNNIDEGYVKHDAVVGKKIAMIPYLGRVISFTKTPTGFLGLIIIPALIYIAFELIAIKNEIVKQTREKVLKEMGMA